MEINHPSHLHPLLLLNQEAGGKREVGDCYACRGAIEGVPSYSCSVGCTFFLHKKCADLPREIHHPLHLPHPLILDEKMKRRSSNTYCDLCFKVKRLTYYCGSCNFDLCVQCVTHTQSGFENLQKVPHFSHKHALTLFTDIESVRVCLGCREPLSSPFYGCFDCRVFLHKACVELPLEINHPHHPKHPLSLLSKPPTHQKGCFCYFCKELWEGFVYYCSLCKFGLKVLESSEALLQPIKVETHEHPYTPFFKPLSFICDACGKSGDLSCFPYTCLECGYMVHRKCISLHQSIKINHHQHMLSHKYFLQEKEAQKRDCNICLDGLDLTYGSYSCLQEHCNYFVHVDCAIDKFFLEEEYQEPKESLHALKEFKHGDEEKHFSHEHSLIYSDQADGGDKDCDGCMRPISTSFFHCAQCSFFLHQNCFELPMESRHWICKHLKSLKFYTIFQCEYCRFYGSGFGYRCDSCWSVMCLRCHEIPKTLLSRWHQHRILFDHNYNECLGCGRNPEGAFKCKECRNVAFEYQCLTLPSIVAYKNDVHPLLLCTSPPDTSDPSQYYCDICEKKGDPGRWFYHCANCNISAHRKCVLGKAPFVKLGKPFMYDGHKDHLVAFVKIDFSPPSCIKCKKPCRDLAIRCTEASCNYIVDWMCLPDPYILH